MALCDQVLIAFEFRMTRWIKSNKSTLINMKDSAKWISRNIINKIKEKENDLYDHQAK